MGITDILKYIHAHKDLPIELACECCGCDKFDKISFSVKNAIWQLGKNGEQRADMMPDGETSMSLKARCTGCGGEKKVFRSETDPTQQAKFETAPFSWRNQHSYVDKEYVDPTERSLYDGRPEVQD